MFHVIEHNTPQYHRIKRKLIVIKSFPLFKSLLQPAGNSLRKEGKLIFAAVTNHKTNQRGAVDVLL